MQCVHNANAADFIIGAILIYKHRYTTGISVVENRQLTHDSPNLSIQSLALLLPFYRNVNVRLCPLQLDPRPVGATASLWDRKRRQSKSLPHITIPLLNTSQTYLAPFRRSLPLTHNTRVSPQGSDWI